MWNTKPHLSFPLRFSRSEWVLMVSREHHLGTYGLPADDQLASDGLPGDDQPGSDGAPGESGSTKV